MQRLDESALTLYAELHDLTVRGETERLARNVVDGSFVTKEIEGKTYWYLQRYEPTGRKQHYLGPETPELLAAMDEVTESRSDLAEDAAVRRRLCKMLEAAGAHRESAAVTKVLKLLSEAHVFRLGGVLVGTQAYGILGNVLGIRFSDASRRTHDIDVAQDPVERKPVLEVGVRRERTSAARALERSELSFLPVPRLDHREPSTSYAVRGRQLRVDFLTPMRGRERSEPIRLETLGVAAQPLRFLDYLLRDSMQATAVGGDGILVQVPDPARFALHKLWTATKRPTAGAGRARKDRAQAAALLEVLVADRPGDLEAAWEGLERHPNVRKKIVRSFDRLDDFADGELKEALLDLLPDTI